MSDASQNWHDEDTCCDAYPDSSFEGVFVTYWPNGQLRHRGAFRKGRKRIGQHLCFYPNGILQEVSYWDDGYATGTVLLFNEDGTKDSEKDFGEFGGRTRSWTERHYSDSKVFFIRVYQNAQLMSKWTEPELEKIEREIGFDDMVNDAFKRLYPDDDA